MGTAHNASAYPGFAGSTPEYSLGAGRFGVMRFHVNIADQITYLASAISGSGGDSLRIWTIPAFTHVLCCGIYLWTPNAAPTATVTLGDSGGAAYWMAAFTLVTAGTTKMTLVSDVNGLTFGKTYNSADYILATFATAGVTTAVFDVFVTAIFYDVPDLATAAPSTWK